MFLSINTKKKAKENHNKNKSHKNILLEIMTDIDDYNIILMMIYVNILAIGRNKFEFGTAHVHIFLLQKYKWPFMKSVFACLRNSSEKVGFNRM